MWGQSFYSDDPLSPKLADEVGVVISTSHHEPMMRAHVEWQRNGGGPWNYNTNEEKLRQFWREGIARMGNNESIVTLAMRGDGDEPMSEDANVKLLEKIVADQRKIIEEVTKKPAADVPQVWALYKEVQDYYDKGMRVPDDVTLLLCDDNWGNLRKLPPVTEKLHPGGYGIYYHFDYVGDPRNYKWINTNPLPRIWEQMNLAWQYGAREIWVVNVGDIKPMEFPIEFFLDYAFDPTIRESELNIYTQRWAAREFGDEHATQIATLLSKYAKFNSRRKPELLGPDTFSPQLYSLVNYREAETVVKDYNVLAEQARTIYDKLAKEYKDAFYQLILYPVQASANLNDMYYSVRLNRFYAAQGRVKTKAIGDRAKRLFERDAELARYYNETMANGKWNHMMDQLRIGYVGWHDTFKENTLPSLDSITPVKGPALGVWVEGSESYFPATTEGLKLPVVSSAGSNQGIVEIFNRGTTPLEVFIEPSASFLKVSMPKMTIEDEKRISILVDWKSAPKGRSSQWIIVKERGGESVKVEVPIENISEIAEARGFVESGGYVSMEAEHFSKLVGEGDVQWKILPDHGRTAGAVTTYPGNAPVSKIHANSPHVEYEAYFTSSGTFKVHCYFSPSIDFTAGDGLNYAVSIDDGPPVTLNVHAANTHRDWQESVKNNIRVVISEHEIKSPGLHTVKFWRVDPGVVLQKLVIDTGGLRSSYLGPPESPRVGK
jgi:hypothetical protein